MDPSTVYAFCGHHRCASTWLRGIFWWAARELGWRYDWVFRPEQFGGDLAGFVRRRGTRLLAYTDAEYDCIAPVAPLRAVHVVRDPRDIVVSAYFSHLHSHPTRGWPELGHHRARLQKLPKQAGLREVLAFLEWEWRALESWPTGDDRILELPFSELVRSPYESVLAIFRFFELVDEGILGTAGRWRAALAATLRRAQEAALGRRLLPVSQATIPAPLLLGFVNQNDYRKVAGGRLRGEADPRAHYRRGVPGDWRNHFDPATARAVRDRLQPLLERRGFAADDRWAAAPPTGTGIGNGAAGP